MKTKNLFSTFLILALVLTACGQGTVAPAPVTQTPVATQPPTDTPTQTPYPTFAPFPNLSSSTPIPYPTASVVKANAVAFIERDNENNLSLWIANVDGSGERKLVENIGKWTDMTNYFLRWSPAGKWISYISNDEMWIISPDGLEKKKVLPAFDKNKRLMSYNWSPDDLQVAYVEVNLLNSKFDSESVRILNLETGKIYEVSTHKPQFYGTILRWSPNGQLLAFNIGATFLLFDAVKHEAKQEILTDTYFCSSTDNTAPVWSPNSEYFFHTHSAAAHYTSIYMCISKMDGSTNRVELGGTILSDVVWDKTGNFLYFVVGRVISRLGDPNLNREPQLQRYDVKTQSLEQLLSLKESSGWSVSISPDGSILEYAEIFENQQSSTLSYTLMDLKSLSVIKKFTLDFDCAWSSDTKNFICLSQSNGYTTFHRLNIQTNESAVFSGEHPIGNWVISPIATTP